MTVCLREEINAFYARLYQIQRDTEERLDERIKKVDLSDGPGLVAGLLARKLFREFNAKIEKEKLLDNEAIKNLAGHFIHTHERYFKGDLCDKIEEKLEKMENANKVIINP